MSQVGDVTDFMSTFSNFSKLKQFMVGFVGNDTRSLGYGSSDAQMGSGFNYSGTTVSSPYNLGTWTGWSTLTKLFTGHTLRLICNTGNFTAGTLEIRGRYL